MIIETLLTFAMFLQQIFQRYTHFLLHNHRIVHMTTDAKQLRTSVCKGSSTYLRDSRIISKPVIWTTERWEPRGATTEDGWSDCDCLDIGNRRWASEHLQQQPSMNISRYTCIKSYSNICREWWLDTWLSLASFKRFNESRLFSANVSTGTTMQIDVIVISCKEISLIHQASSWHYKDVFKTMPYCTWMRTWATSIFTQKASLVSLMNGFLQYHG